MTPFVRMQLRMLLPCLLPLPLGLALAWTAAVAEGVPLSLDLWAVPVVVPQMIFLGSLLLAALCLGVQTWRLWRWLSGVGAACDGCGSMLRAREGRQPGDTRRCLRCSRDPCIAP